MSNFKKTALAATVATLALAPQLSSAATYSDAGEYTIIGCSVPANGTAGGTVYSVDAYDADGAALTGLPGIVKVGSNCSRAVNAVITGGAGLVGFNNQTIANSGYSLQTFTLGASGGTTGNLMMVGCGAPASGTAGAVVYSVDAQQSSGSAISSTLNGAVGGQCSSSLAVINNISSANAVAPSNVTIQTVGYSLNQYVVQ